jgi:hypothetical protein
VKTKIKLHARERLWQVMSQECGRVFTSAELSQLSQISCSYSYKILNKFHKEGWIYKEVKEGNIFWQAKKGAKVFFRRSGRVKGQRILKNIKKTARQRIWNSLKILTKCSTDQLLMTSNASLKSIDKYLSALEKSGYVKCINRRKNSNGKYQVMGKYRVYMLLNNTGRLYPIVRKDGCWDQNKQQLYPFNGMKKENHHDQVA